MFFLRLILKCLITNKSLLDGFTYSAHDAKEDVKALAKFMKCKNMTENTLLSNPFSLHAIHRAFVFSGEKSKNINSLTVPVARGIMKRQKMWLAQGCRSNI